MSKIVIFLMLVFFVVLFTGCPDPLTPTVVDDDISLSEVLNLQTTYTDGTVMIFYEEPTDPDFTGTELTFLPAASGVNQPIILLKGEGLTLGKSLTGAGGLTNGTEYTFTLKAVYADGSKSAGLTTIVTPSDIVAAPLNVAAAIADGEVVLSWNEPAVNNWAFVEITFTPVVAPHPLAVSVGTTSISISGLANDTEYVFILTATDLFSVASTDVIISATPTFSGDITPPANVTGLSSKIVPKGVVYDILQFIAFGDDYNPDFDDEFPFDYFMEHLKYAGNQTNAIYEVIWTDPTDSDYVETELKLTRNSDSYSETVTVNSGIETYQFNNIIIGDSYTLSTRTGDISNNWSASNDSIITSTNTEITQLDLIFDPDDSPDKVFQIDYDYSVTDQLDMNWFSDDNDDDVFDIPMEPGDLFSCKSYRNIYNSNHQLISFSGYLDHAQSEEILKYEFNYNVDFTLQSIRAHIDSNNNGVIEVSDDGFDYYEYIFGYSSGVLNEIELNGITSSSPSVYHKYTFAYNNDGKLTQAHLYFDAVNLTLDTNPTLRWDFTYDINDRVCTVERSNDSDLSGSFTYDGKYEYLYNVAGNLDSIFVYSELNEKGVELDYIY